MTEVPTRLWEWLTEAVERQASDLHIAPHYPPMLRIHGVMSQMDQPPLDPHLLRDLLLPICPVDNLAQLEESKNTDFSWQLEINGSNRRFRVNVFHGGGELGACFRVIPDQIPEFDWAGFPAEIAQRLAHFRNGLVLISGVAGSGKTTTLAMIINLINQEGGRRIITVEEPVEYVFERRPNSFVTQREVGVDVRDFADGLKYGLRQDPDIILVGEIRDRDTAQMALSAAETGHLVYSTLHTRDAKGAVSRFVDLFPQSVQGDIRSQLALSLRAVVSQHLLPSTNPDGQRVLALEIMFNSSAIGSAIRFGKLETIDNSILTGRSDGMITLNESLKRLLQDGRITRETAIQFSTDVRTLGVG